jgi:hypothetical protein
MEQEAILIFAFKVISLLCGVFTIYLGYKLFVKGIFNEAGDLKATWSDKGLLVKKAAPGTFFALFGAIVIFFSIYKGLDFHSSVHPGRLNEKTLIQPSLNDSFKLNNNTQ